MGWLATENINVNGPYVDVQIAEPLIDENRNSYALGSLAWKYLKEWKTEELLNEAARIHGYKNPKAELYRLHSKYVGQYAEGDARIPLEIWEKQQKELTKDDLWGVYELEIKLVPLLFKMRQQGVPIDLNKVEETKDKIKVLKIKAAKELYNVCKLEFNIWSGKQIASVCDEIGLWYPKTTKGNPSFQKEWITAQQNEHDFFKYLAEVRKFDKAISTFIDGAIYDHVIDGRIHATAHQLRKDGYGTVTGRFSYSNPNLQQIPARDEVLAPLIRGFFIPDPEQMWFKADYSQQEPRIQIHYANALKIEGIEKFVEQYKDDPNTDYHSFVAELASIDRRSAKDINLGLAYGMGRKRLIKKLGVSKEEGERLWESYFNVMTFIKELQQVCTRKANGSGFIKTLSGRRRRFNSWEPRWSDDEEYIPMSYSSAHKKWGDNIKRAWTYKALNAAIQGSAADMMKKSMIALYEEEGYVPYFSVHDEINGPIEDEKTMERFKKIMQDCFPLCVPNEVNCSIVNNWGETCG
jgi:DNA polymerase I-like protein with 3'-5' exonuclease and polymerase domains